MSAEWIEVDGVQVDLVKARERFGHLQLTERVLLEVQIGDEIRVLNDRLITWCRAQRYGATQAQRKILDAQIKELLIDSAEIAGERRSLLALAGPEGF